MKNRSLLIVISVLAVLTIGWVFFVIQPKTIAKPTINSVEGWITLLNTELLSLESANNKKELIKWFCDITYKQQLQEWFTDGTEKAQKSALYYTPQQSLFIWVLCQPFSQTPFLYPKLLKKADNNNNSRVFLPWVPKSCDPTTDMKDCDFAILLPALFSAIMNDHSTLSMAWWTWTNEDESTIIKNFSDMHFGIIWQDQCKWKDRYFLDNKSSSTKEEAICSHPKTYALLKNTIWDLKKQEKNIQTLNIDNLKEESAKIQEKDCSNENYYTNIFLCWYSASYKDNSKKRWFQYNLQFNELLYYRILIAKLSEVLEKENIAPLDLTKTQLTANKQATINPEVQNLSRELLISQKAVTTMQKTLDGFHATFPLHIWLSAYYEDVVNLRKSIVKVYTPINQLYYKLRNIQQKQ